MVHIVQRYSGRMLWQLVLAASLLTSNHTLLPMYPKTPKLNVIREPLITGVVLTCLACPLLIGCCCHRYCIRPCRQTALNKNQRAPEFVQQLAHIFAKKMCGNNPLLWLRYWYAQATGSLCVYNGPEKDEPDFFEKHTDAIAYAKEYGGIFSPLKVSMLMNSGSHNKQTYAMRLHIL